MKFGLAPTTERILKATLHLVSSVSIALPQRDSTSDIGRPRKFFQKPRRICSLLFANFGSDEIVSAKHAATLG